MAAASFSTRFWICLALNALRGFLDGDLVAVAFALGDFEFLGDFNTGHPDDRAIPDQQGNRIFFFSSRRRHTRSVSAFLLNRSSDLQDDARYGFRCCHLKNIWTAPLPPETELSRQMTTSTTSIDIMGLQAAYANLHTDQERDYFMQRYHDVISSFGGKTSYDADN